MSYTSQSRRASWFVCRALEVTPVNRFTEYTLENFSVRTLVAATSMRATFAKLGRAKPAQGLTEYGLVLGLASLAAVAALTIFGGNLAGNIGNALGTVVSNFPSP